MHEKAQQKKCPAHSDGIRCSKIQAYSEKIERTWNRALESIFLVGDLLREAQRELTSREYSALLNQLSFGPRVGERLAAIAADKRLRRKSIQKLLPPCWTTLDVIQRFSDDTFSTAVEQKRITPGVTRKEMLSLWNETKEAASIKSPSASRKKSAAVVGGAACVAIQVPDDFSDQQALLDLNFLYYVCSKLFSAASSSRRKVDVTFDAPRLPGRAKKAFEACLKLIELGSKIEKSSRDRAKNQPLTGAQEIFSLLGADPDGGGCLLERITLAYCRRLGLECVDSRALHKVISQGDSGRSFFKDAERLVASVLSKSGSKRSPTRIIVLDSDEEPTVETLKSGGLHAPH